MRALVTGCAGFIGSHLTESLLEDGCDVVGVDCFNRNYARREKLRNLARARSWENFDFVPIDLADGELEEFVAESDVVFHLASEPGVRSSWGRRFETYIRNNVIATHHLLTAMRAHPGKRLVYASSSSVYGQAERFPTPEDVVPAPQSPYGVTKLSAEHLCASYHENFGVDAVSLRYFSVYGPRQRPDMAFSIFCAAALDGAPLTVFGDGDQTRDFTYVADVVAATRRAGTAADVGGGIYNVGGGAQNSLNEGIAVIEECAGHPLVVQRSEVQPGDVRDTSADTTRAQADLGLVSTVPFREGLQRQFSWFADERVVAPHA
jgi:nucleoside-diphosphate-sugar epimerase